MPLSFASKTQGFCEGCEFAGSIPSGKVPVKAAEETTEDSNVRATVLFDTELRMSNAFVSRSHPEDAPNPHELSRIISEKRRCVGKCVLEAAGYVPIEFTRDKKRGVMEQMLNSFSGVNELGEVEYIEDDEKDDVAVNPVTSEQM